MLSSNIIQVICLIGLVQPQEFVWENNKIGNNYMDHPHYKVNNKDWVDVLKKGGVPNKVAMQGIDALKAFKQY